LLRTNGYSVWKVRTSLPTLIARFAALMCDTSGDRLAHAGVLVVGKTDEQARQALAAAWPDRLVIDRRGGAPR
jgi:hypothetical protein